MVSVLSSDEEKLGRFSCRFLAVLTRILFPTRTIANVTPGTLIAVWFRSRRNSALILSLMSMNLKAGNVRTTNHKGVQPKLAQPQHHPTDEPSE